VKNHSMDREDCKLQFEGCRSQKPEARIGEIPILAPGSWLLASGSWLLACFSVVM
jgi:hypothetical protein